MKILVMGLPGAGKTWLSERLQKSLQCAWYNADKVRAMANDWDFSPEGRVRQANRMKTFADYEKAHNRFVICDFVCPTALTRFIFDADITIWMNTIAAGRFQDTNKMFEEPMDFDYLIEEFMTEDQVADMAKRMKETYNGI